MSDTSFKVLLVLSWSFLVVIALVAMRVGC